MKTVLCDVDEVCADLLSEWVRRYNLQWDDTLRPEDIDCWDLSSLVKPECGKRIYDILREPDLYLHVKPIPLALAGVRSLRALGYRVVFVTSCVVDTTDAKINWLIRNKFLPREKTPRDFIAAKDKSLVRGDVLIDDGAHNVEAYPGATVLFDQPHNRNFDHQYRAHTWGDVVEIISANLQD